MYRSLKQIRCGSTDIEQHGVPMLPSPEDPTAQWVIQFPVAAPAGAITCGDLTAVEQLGYWYQLKLRFCDQNPSTTISYRSEEVAEVIDWVWEHQAVLGGITLLPHDQNAYQLAPFEAISEDEYHARNTAFPQIELAADAYHPSYMSGP
jgi:ribonucleoside-triphosphate reductase (thioredoxin)